jgi:alkanesulfonate monooxygenase SsuD/methylene tetrahydromethanopterin reductase-like flavin-dependent oxidoreductase (luciferase family)
MKFNVFVLPTVPGTPEDRARLRPIGRNRERLGQMYEEVIEVCQLAEDVGFESFSTTEHHFHSEGFEVSASPLVLYSHLAAICKRIIFAPLGVVLPTWDPIRLAEEIATLDHLSHGRVMVGLARGYQSRWTNVLGQKYHAQGATMDGSAVDEQNREVFEEVLEVMIKAWTQDSFTHRGKYYQVPSTPEGVDWPCREVTESYGAPGEIDPVTGKSVEISVTPAPLQDPHPRFWQGYAASESTVLRCAARGITPFILVSKPEQLLEFCTKYQHIAAENGRKLALGEGVGVTRGVVFGDTFEEAYELGVKTVGYVFGEYLARFGFVEIVRRPDDNPAFPLNLGGARQLFQRLWEDGLVICGTPDDVKRKIEDVATCHGDGNLEYFSWQLLTQGIAPLEVTRQQLELFGKHIIPEFA